MICTKCKLAFNDGVDICPQCNTKTIEDRRIKNRRQRQDPITGEERRSSDRRKKFIKRFEEVFYKGDTKYC